MTEVTLAQILEGALRLSYAEQRQLIDLLRASAKVAEPIRTIQQIAALEGKMPLNFSEVRRLGEFFPAEESVDDLVHTVMELRHDHHVRSVD